MTHQDLEYITLYACCIPVRGKQRSLICDLQRVKYDLIPNSLVDIIDQLSENSLSELKRGFDEDDLKTFDDYISFLIENEYAFYSTKNEIDLFPKLPLTWESPEIISNAIVDHKTESQHNYAKIAKELDTLGCMALELRFYDLLTLDRLIEILKFFDNSRLRHIDIIIKYQSTLNDESLEDLCNQFSRIAFIVVHNSPVDKEYRCLDSNAKILYSKELIKNNKHCGIVNSSLFVINTSQVVESHNFNSCLNKKIAIDEEGLIKNCPSFSNNYGNINDGQSLIDTALNKDFQKLWLINKDKVSICRDCEFRYICTDCRAFLDNPEELLSKPLKCGYDPYTNKWKEWSTNPLKQKAKNFYQI